jgi:hypothetical protein
MTEGGTRRGFDTARAPADTAPMPTAGPAPRRLRETVRFDRNELAGAFGDIGTDFPLLVAMILVAGLDAASVLIVFGALQILSALLYGLPMPVQPLKAMAAIVITQRLGAEVLYGGGLAIGVAMLFLTVTGAIAWLARVVPKSVVRGIQFGLGLQLSLLALQDYVRADGATGYALGAGAFAVTVALLGNRRVPAAPVVILLGAAFALLFRVDAGRLLGEVALRLPEPRLPAPADVLTGFLLLALPQIPLSLGNSILATRQVSEDLFPARAPSVRKISLTYSLMNLVSPFLAGVPVCHGSAGMVGHYTFGARTGGSVLIYGALYLGLGLLFSGAFHEVIQLFPKPVLGVILLFEGVALLLLVRDTMTSVPELTVVLLVGLMAVGLPYGYLIGLVAGTVLAHLVRRGRLQLVR